MGLYLHCAICSRKQADGLLSGAAWGRVEVPAGSAVDYPGLKDSALRCCPNCINTHPDWQQSALASLGIAGGLGAPLPKPA